MDIKKLNISAAFQKVDTYWDPKIVAELNDQMVKIARLQGEFVWHSHEEEDELFFVVEGNLKIELRGHPAITLGPGELVVIPRGVEHKPVATSEVSLLLFEPSTTINTGATVDSRTKLNLDRIDC